MSRENARTRAGATIRTNVGSADGKCCFSWRWGMRACNWRVCAVAQRVWQASGEEERWRRTPALEVSACVSRGRTAFLLHASPIVSTCEINQAGISSHMRSRFIGQ
jgi:hypothetical protein